MTGLTTAMESTQRASGGWGTEVTGKKSSEELVATAAKWRAIFEMKPRRLGALLLRALGPWERRRIVESSAGVRLYLDPFTPLGQQMLLDGAYEPETVELLRGHLRPGDVFLDVGANEGFYSALAGMLVGSEGMVLAVEPQLACRDLLEINLRINGVTRARIYTNAMGGADGEPGSLFRYAPVNTGLSSIVTHYHSTAGTEGFRFVSLERILREAAIAHVNLAKIDVEGFEPEVVECLIPHIRSGQLRALLVEYHPRILARRKLSPGDIHATLLQNGMAQLAGNPEAPDGQGRVLYTRR